MLAQLRAAGLIWPTLSALAALAVLLGLGTWQMQRKAWKDGILADITAAAMRAPVDYSDIRKGGPAPPVSAVQHVEMPEFVRVQAKGRWLHDQTAYVYTLRAGQAGYHVFTPLQLEGNDIVPVNRGFVPEDLRNAGALRAASASPVEISGFTRHPERDGLFTPAPDPARRTTYGSYPWTLIAPAAATSPGGFFIEATDRQAGEIWPQPRGLDGLVKTIPNRHLEYALTWYGLALTLIGVYLAFARMRLKQVTTEVPGTQL